MPALVAEERRQLRVYDRRREIKITVTLTELLLLLKMCVLTSNGLQLSENSADIKAHIVRIHKALQRSDDAVVDASLQTSCYSCLDIRSC